jgi:hypothetical protein
MIKKNGQCPLKIINNGEVKKISNPGQTDSPGLTTSIHQTTKPGRHNHADFFYL